MSSGTLRKFFAVTKWYHFCGTGPRYLTQFCAHLRLAMFGTVRGSNRPDYARHCYASPSPICDVTQRLTLNRGQVAYVLVIL